MSTSSSYKKHPKSCEEMIIVDLPDYHTVLGTDLDMVCRIKRLNDNTVKYICMSERNQELRYMVLNMLDKCIDQIHILCGGRSVSSRLAFFDDIFENKSSVYYPIYDQNTGEPFKVAFKRRQANKFYNDGAKLNSFLAAIRDELFEFHSFELFRKVMHDVKVKKKEALILFQDTFENLTKMKELKLALITQGKDSRLEIHKVNNSYKTSCDIVQDVLFKNTIQLRYAKAYERSRYEQNKHRSDIQFRELQTIISKYERKIENENRAHSEILIYMDDSQKDLRDNIKIWVKKYNAETELGHFKILQIKDRLEELQKNSEMLKNLFAEHKKSIIDFKEYKEKKLKEEKEEQRLADAATKIQAWWRGTMYRRQLGPYNPNPKKRKGKDKKKKKK